MWTRRGPFRCLFCRAVFRSRKDRTRHVRYWHEKGKRLKAPWWQR